MSELTSADFFNDYELFESFSETGSFLPSIRYPEDDCCIMYEHSNFAGKELYLCHNQQPYYKGSLSNYDFEEGGSSMNQISSYVCGKSIWWNFCKESGQESCFGENSIISGAGHTWNRNLVMDNWNDEIEGFHIGIYDAWEMGAINLYSAKDCEGPSARVYYNPDDVNGGQYNLEDLRKMGYTDNSADSIQVPEGYTAYLYNDKGLQTLVATVVGKYVNYNHEELQCVNLESLGAKDKVSSVIVKRHEPAIGYWQSITSTESQEYTLHVGINYELAEGTSEEIQQSLTLAMEMGINYGVGSASWSVESDYATTLRHDVQSVYGLEYSVESATSCTTDGKNGAGLFQWVVATPDYQYQAFTWHTICRTGEGFFNVSPDCPWYSCKDAECIVCDTDFLADDDDLYTFETFFSGTLDEETGEFTASFP